MGHRGVDCGLGGKAGKAGEDDYTADTRDAVGEQEGGSWGDSGEVVVGKTGRLGDASTIAEDLVAERNRETDDAAVGGLAVVDEEQGDIAAVIDVTPRVVDTWEQRRRGAPGFGPLLDCVYPLAQETAQPCASSATQSSLVPGSP